MLSLFDAHSHLTEIPPPRESHHRVVCGTCEADWEPVLARAASDDHVIPMLGLHPWQVLEATPGWQIRLETLLQSHRAGVGECGLDYARKDSDRATQKALFRAQLQLAHRLHRPVAMHIVRAWGPLLDLLREEGVPAAGAMVHAYSGSPDTARSLQSMGVFLSFSGDLLNPARAKVRESLLAVENAFLLFETDGTADLEQVVVAAAELRDMPAWALAHETWENGHRCFKELMA